MLPAAMAEELLRAGRLQRVLPQAPLPVVGIYALYPSRDYLSARARVFLEHLQASFAQLDAAP